MVELIIENLETLQIIQALTIPVTAVMSLLVIAACLKYLLKKK